MLSCLAFLYFNFRRKALCFPGDVGSITIGFWIIFLLLKVIVISGNWNYLLFISVYGVDTILTIIQRLYLRQNIFVAHRIHFFQLLNHYHCLYRMYSCTFPHCAFGHHVTAGGFVCWCEDKMVKGD